ncbi:MAG: hypothetical protein JWQ97_3325, partial [Phenylobacterium sp.]|nr:hypothetical protein [Phenylobacterium sp.]
MVLVGRGGATQSAGREASAWRARAAPALALLAGVLVWVVLAIGLRHLPVGPSYSDSYMFLDAAHRIASGERPHIDFFSPMGPLPLYLFAALNQVAPRVQPVVAAQLPYALLAAAALWPITATAQRRPAALAAALLFVLLAAAPYNWGDFKGFAVDAQADGYGVYNRDAGLVLFALAAAAWLRPSVRIQAAASGVLLAVLFFTKLTAFPAGLAVAGWGLLRRRAAGADWLLLIAPGLVAALAAQLAGGLLADYLHDVARLGRAGGLWSVIDRLRDELRAERPILVLLVVVLAIQLRAEARSLRRISGLRRAPHRLALGLLRTRAFGFALLLAGALFVESQNTGSQAFAFVAPAALALAPRTARTTAARLRLAAGVAPALLIALYLGASFLALAREAPQLVPLRQPGLERFQVSARPQEIAAAEQVL